MGETVPVPAVRAIPTNGELNRSARRPPQCSEGRGQRPRCMWRGPWDGRLFEPTPQD